MARHTFKLNRRGVIEVLRSDEVARAIHDYAERVATSTRSSRPEADVVVDDYTTDRRASSVTIRDVRGRLWEARDGVLTRAAAAQGLEVTRRTD